MWNNPNCSNSGRNVWILMSLYRIYLYLCSQGEAETWGEPVNGAKRGSGSLCWDHGSTHHLYHVTLVGPEARRLHISRTHALNNLITVSQVLELFTFLLAVDKCFLWHIVILFPWMNGYLCVFSLTKVKVYRGLFSVSGCFPVHRIQL